MFLSGFNWFTSHFFFHSDTACSFRHAALVHTNRTGRNRKTVWQSGRSWTVHFGSFLCLLAAGGFTFLWCLCSCLSISGFLLLLREGLLVVTTVLTPEPGCVEGSGDTVSRSDLSFYWVSATHKCISKVLSVSLVALIPSLAAACPL